MDRSALQHLLDKQKHYDLFGRLQRHGTKTHLYVKTRCNFDKFFDS